MHSVRLFVLPLVMAGLAVSSAGQEVEITVEEVADGIYMLRGQGGNIGLVTGADATFMIDDQYAPLTEKITAAVAELTERPIDFVLNTHWHGDRTGGNENLGRAGAWIVAHENVRQRMSAEQFIEVFNLRTTPAPAVALPVVTFEDSMTFHLNGHTIKAVHLEPDGHTDGDSLMFFEEVNVVHMGDTYFAGMYPFIDVGTGGTVAGMIRSADRVLALIDDETRLIPGHGPLSNRAGLQEFRDMLAGIHEVVSGLVAAGRSREEGDSRQVDGGLGRGVGEGFLEPRRLRRYRRRQCAGRG
ncbi:MAG: MBL fold metallo-hydrolase [Acidobacteria bacterium]|nr:MBL fold metallo-hydrolase [Acidobacteriota bacterium]